VLVIRLRLAHGLNVGHCLVSLALHQQRSYQIAFSQAVIWIACEAVHGFGRSRRRLVQVNMRIGRNGP
jgi:hypothetical protein